MRRGIQTVLITALFATALPPTVFARPASTRSSAAAHSVRVPIPAPKAGEAVSFASVRDLGNFDYDADKGGNIPADVLALNGSTVRLRGFMIPMDQAESITSFALVPALPGCQFCAPVPVQEVVVARVPKGKALAYFPDELVVEGKLTVREKKEDGCIVSIFELDVTSVKPAEH
jgi:hypothetical protein